MFPAYGGGGGGRGGGGGGRRHNNNNYNNNNNGNYNNNRYYREPRLPPGGYGRSQPPPRLDVGDRRNGNNDVLLPEPVYGQFVANEDQFRLANEARQRETERRARQRQIEAQIIAQQEQSVYGLKQITPDEFDEDEDDIIPMAAPQERIVIVERRVIVKKKKSKKSKKNKKNKKKKHRKHRSRSSSSSSSSSGSESESVKANGSSSRKRRHGPDEGGEESTGEGTSAQAAKRQRQAPPAQEKEIISELDATLNPWTMLRKNEYNQFKSAYIVIERRPDYANLQYERAYKFELADYRSVLKPNAQLRDLHAISQQWTKLIWKPDQTLLTKEERWTADRHIQAMNELAERAFRRGVNPNFVDYVTLSHQPCAEDEEGQASSVPKREQLEQHHLNNMDFNDYAHYLESQKKSYEEAKVNDLEGRFSILHNKKTTNRHDVDAWLEFVDIQRLKFAKDESGDPEAPIQNERAYYERVMEIVGQAIRANQTSPELHIKQLLLMEQRGDSKQQLKHEWDRCLNRFQNNCKIWEENLKMQMNDRSKFGLEEMLHQIDFCIGKLVGIKSGTIRSHKLILGTEEFLVDLLVMRCRLLIATGYIDRAVSMLQALAEFHFFHPEELDTPEMKMKQNTVQRNDRALRLFQEFWRSGVHRIGMGTDHAEGWCNFEGEEEEDGGQQVDIAMQEEEEAHLGGIRERFEKALKKEVEEYKRKGLSLVEARRRLDAFKARYHWYPVRFQAHHADLYEYESRYVTYKQVRPVLFFFVDEKLAQELMFKLLHQFGVSVKGLNLTTSQEDILRSFSPSMFPSHRPSAMGLDHFEQFFTQFVRMLASSPHMDGVRMYTALVSIIYNSTATKDKKWEEMYEMVRSNLPTMPQYRSGEVVSNAVQMALCTCLFDEMLKLKPAREANFPLNTCLRMLFLNFDQKPHSSLWELQQKVHRSEEARLEYLFMLRFVVLICRHLPYSDERRDTGVKVEIKANKREMPACCLETKRDFLLSIWATGKVGKVDMTDANLLEAAKKRARNVLRNPPPHDLEDLRMRWLGCPHELLFELAALYFYEFPWTPEQRYKFFSVGDTLFYRSQLGTALQDRPALQEMRVRVLQHITHSTTEYSPGQLVHLLEEQVDRFPHSVELLKTLLDVSRRHRRQIFLSKSPGQDKQTRLLRDCGRLYAERVRLNQDFKRLQAGSGGGGNEKEFKSLLSRFIEIFKRTAQAYSDNFIPDDYIWCRLLQQLVTCPDHIPSQALDEVFLLGHKVVPWSKAFLFEAARDRPGAQSSFMSTLESALAQAGLHSFLSFSSFVKC